MLLKSGRTFHVKALTTLAIVWTCACSTTVIDPLPVLPEAPKFTEVPHPDGYDLADIQGIFRSHTAPEPNSLSQCDAVFLKLSAATQSLPELTQGTIELVRTDPERYHWCFYWKMASLQEILKVINSQSDRQSKVIETYRFLVPVAQGFRESFQDSRYLRQAIHHYQLLSEWIFSRRVVPSPETTAELTLKDYSNPFAQYRRPEDPAQSVLEKYGLQDEAKKQNALPTSAPASERAPSSEGRDPMPNELPSAMPNEAQDDLPEDLPDDFF